MTDLKRVTIALIAGIALLVAGLFCVHKSQAREYIDGTKINWADIAEDFEVSAWIKNLKQPDNPEQSCCGDSDAYWADSFETANCTQFPSEANPFPTQETCYVAIITDDRPDEPRGRMHRPVGEKHIVPTYKLKFDDGNPTGHGVIFLNSSGSVYCYVTPGGV